MTTLPGHLFVSSGDGSLYDTREEGWSGKRPVRLHYNGHFPIEGLRDVKACLRAGPYAWPGGYPLYFVTRDGAALSFDAAMKQFHSVASDFLDDCSTGWRIVACQVNYEDADLTCDHTGKRIPSAYGDDDNDD